MGLLSCVVCSYSPLGVALFHKSDPSIQPDDLDILLTLPVNPLTRDFFWISNTVVCHVT